MYRTKTYLAADWDNDREIIDLLRKWNNSNHWALSFADAHELKQARDTSMYCNIKRSLADRLNESKTFVLVVGSETKDLRAGACRYCGYYLSSTEKCFKEHYIDHKSYIEFECEKAVKDRMKIVVIYNYANIDKSKCPVAVKNIGKHISAYNINSLGFKNWNYFEIRDAIMF